MKTPDEIKKGLECCSISHDYCGTECPYNCYANGSAKLSLLKDALAYIQQLEKRLADVNASPFDGGMSQQEYLNGAKPPMKIRQIDANALYDKIKHLYEVDKKATGANAYDLCAMLIEDAPTIETESVKHGKWIPVDGYAPCDEWECTACWERKTFLYKMDCDEMKDFYSYCPNCGAKMDVEGAEDATDC